MSRSLNLTFAWKIGQGTGWGRYGLGLALALRRAGHGVILRDGIAPEAGPIHATRFLLEQVRMSPDSVVLHPVGNSFDPCPPDENHGVRDRLHVGLLVTECSSLNDRQIDHLKTYDLLLAGCEWTRKVLAAHEIPSHAFPQGVDTLTFSPGRQRPPRARDDPFLIFSGGKIEFRKGHDLAVETFKRLRRGFPEIPATLVTSWHNFWPNTIGGLHHTGHLTSLPTFTEGRWNFAEWLETQGIPRSEVIVLEPMLPEQLAAVIRECDAGLFLSRAEGNVNMSLAECCACGVPVVASGNTGHLEYVDEPLVTLASTWPLQQKTLPDYAGLEGWGEVNPGEAAAMLAMLAKDDLDVPYPFADDAERRRDDAWHFADRWSWDARAAALVQLLETAVG